MDIPVLVWNESYFEVPVHVFRKINDFSGLVILHRLN